MQRNLQIFVRLKSLKNTWTFCENICSDESIAFTYTSMAYLGQQFRKVLLVFKITI